MALADSADRAQNAGWAHDIDRRYEAFVEGAGMIGVDRSGSEDGPAEEADNQIAEPNEQTGNDDVEAEPERPEAESEAAPEDEGTDDSTPEEKAEGEEGSEEPDEYIELTFEDGSIEKLTPDQYRDGFLRQRDYSAKMNEISTARSQMAEREQQFAQWMVEKVQTIQSFEEAEPNWAELKESDPFGYIEQKDAWDARQKQRAELVQQQQALSQQHFRRQAVEGYRSLVQKVPEWSDPSQFDRDVSAYRATAASEYGFAEAELAQINDPRIVLLLRDLHTMKAGQSKATAAVKKVKAAPQLAPSGRANATAPRRGHPNQVRAALVTNLKKTGRPEDATKVFMEMLERQGG
jgi:hypothetical protein